MGRPVIRSIAIVGASLAGTRVAEALRARGFGGSIALVGREIHLPYERPPLSKEFLLRREDADMVPVRDAAQWDALEVDMILGEEVASLATSDTALEFRGGRRLRADRVILCTGGRSRPLNVPGRSLSGIYYLRTIEDALALRSALTAGKKIVIVGGGFIGAEVASSATQLGCAVTILEGGDILMQRGLGPVWGQFMMREHARRGVVVRTGVKVRSFYGDNQCRGVELDDGEIVAADAVLVAIGMMPATEVAEAAGIGVDGGIVVDSSGRTSHPAVLAAGDVTAAPKWRARGRLRFESVRHAENQAEALASVLLGHPRPEPEVPWFWSDQFDYNIQLAGSLSDFDDVVVRKPSPNSFVAIHLKKGEMRGVFAINRGRDVRAVMRLIAHRATVTRDALRDGDVDLRSLVADSR